MVSILKLAPIIHHSDLIIDFRLKIFNQTAIITVFGYPHSYIHIPKDGTTSLQTFRQFLSSRSSASYYEIQLIFYSTNISINRLKQSIKKY